MDQLQFNFGDPTPKAGIEFLLNSKEKNYFKKFFNRFCNFYYQGIFLYK